MAKKTDKEKQIDQETAVDTKTESDEGTVLILPQIAGRLFGTPLAIQEAKLDVIMAAITPRLLGEMKFGQPPVRAQHEELSVSMGGIAVIQVHGTLVKRASMFDSLSGLTSYSSIEAQVQAALQAPEVSGILLSFDSSGGEVNGMVDAADLIFQSRGQKPIWAIADDWAFSAAYGLASAAERIFIPITGEVGSVGVLAMHRNQSGKDEKDGLSFEFVHAGALKVDGNPHEPLSQSARERLQQHVNATNVIFTDMVAKHRGMSGEAVRALEAGTFQGQTAIEKGLADEIGSFRSVLTKFEAHVRADTESTGVPGLQGQDAGAGTTKIISLEDQRQKIRTEEEAKAADKHAAYRKEVQQLCKLAGKPDLALGYIDQDLALQAVREALINDRADQADGQVVQTQHSGEPATVGKQMESTREIYARRAKEAAAANVEKIGA